MISKIVSLSLFFPLLYFNHPTSHSFTKKNNNKAISISFQKRQTPHDKNDEKLSKKDFIRELTLPIITKKNQ